MTNLVMGFKDHNEITLHRVHDRLNIYEQQLLFHRQEIDELKKIVMEIQKENKIVTRQVFDTLNDIKLEFRKDLSNARSDFNKMIVGTQRWTIGLLVTIIVQTFIVVLTVALQKGII